MTEFPPDPGHEQSHLRCYDVLRGIGALAVDGRHHEVRAAVDCLSDADLTQLFVVAEMHAMAVAMAARSGPLRAITTEG